MTIDEKEKLINAKEMLTFLLTIEDASITMAVIESIIETLDEMTQ